MIFLKRGYWLRWLGVAICVCTLGAVGCMSTYNSPGGSISGYGISVTQPDNAIESAQLDIVIPDESQTQCSEKLPAGTAIKVRTGIPVDVNEVRKVEIKESSSKWLLYAGIACLIGGLFVATIFKYPTPGGLLSLGGVALIGIHQYPWLAGVASALIIAAGAIVLGYEIAEKNHKSGGTES